LCLTFRLDALTTVGQLLDFLPQIMDRYRWSPEDVSLRHLPAVDASQAEAAAPGFYVCFRRKLPPEQTQYLARIIHAQFACEAIAVPPGLSLYPLPRFLEESFPLVPSIPSRGGYQDLLVAVYEEESFARIYESFPKNPQYHQSPEIWFLEGLPGAEEGAAANRPVCLFTVPRAPVDERPAQWLQMSNRRRADGSDLFKLFCRLPARRGSADYYVEFGWQSQGTRCVLGHVHNSPVARTIDDAKTAVAAPRTHPPNQVGQRRAGLSRQAQLSNSTSNSTRVGGGTLSERENRDNGQSTAKYPAVKHKPA